MARISGVNIPSGKRIEVALTYVFGIGATRAKKICKDASLEPNKRVNSLTEDELTRIRDIVEKNYTVEGDLRREISKFKRLIDLGCYRGLRHRKGLPVKRPKNKY